MRSWTPIARGALVLATVLTLAAATAATAAARSGPQAGPTHDEVAHCRLAQCGSLASGARRACMKTCGRAGRCPRVRTIAYVLNRCRTDADGLWEAHQALWIRRGDRPPVKVMEFGSGRVRDPFAVPLIAAIVRTVPDLAGITSLCQLLGELRSDDAFQLIGNFQRIDVTPDGSGVVFEVTGDFSMSKRLREDPERYIGIPVPPDLLAELEDLFVPPEQTGFFYVRADGTGLRRIADASRDPFVDFSLQLGDERAPLIAFGVPTDPLFSPNGRRIVYTDRVGTNGDTAITTLDVVTGQATQVHQLPDFSLGIVAFADDDTIIFRKDRNAKGPFHSVETDGTRLQELPVPDVATPANAILPEFYIAGRGGKLFTQYLIDPTKNDDSCQPATNEVPYRDPCTFEVFLLTRRSVLQLSSFGRSDTIRGFVDVSRPRAFFRASADPFGSNPTENCQVFSVDTLGQELRQVTFFREADRSEQGCTDGRRRGCNPASIWQDPVTRAVVLTSSCDPFVAPESPRRSETPREFVEAGNFHGTQMFALRPSGSGLCRLTNFAGLAFESNGAVSTELPGPIRYPGRIR